MTNTYMQAGEHAPEEIIASVKNGIYAKDFSGGSVDTARGTFNFGCSECYRIENGKVTAPLRGVSLIGSGPSTFKQVEMVGSDLRFSEAGWRCGKNGQFVPVGLGMPTVKIGRMTVGGTKA